MVDTPQGTAGQAQRYRQLLQLIAQHRPARIVEIGTWNGDRAVEMCRQALKYHEKVSYAGFDLFELATQETDERELNVKPHVKVAAVRKKLKDAFGDSVDISLFKGDTRTVEEIKPADFAFIDGGHSIETVRHDFGICTKAGIPIIALDDYYAPDSDGNMPDITKFGCNALIGQEIVDWGELPQMDPVKDGGLVGMIVVPSKALGGKTQLIVKTKSCVPEEEIRENVTRSFDFSLPTLPILRRHRRIAVLCSGGPSLDGYFPEIRRMQEEGAYVVCVKHAHDRLIAAGIVPWACVLLDPRSHVSEFIERPHPDTLYMVASMCHPSTAEGLIKRGARTFIYHAAVGSGEEQIVKQMGGGTLVGGGCATATRAFGLLDMLGFWRFRLFGYDLCYYEEKDLTEIGDNGQPKYTRVEVNKKMFWTDPEKVAQVQDLSMLMKQGREMEIVAYGPGIGPHVVMTVPKIMSFEEQFGG